MGFELAVNGLSFSLNNVDLYKVAGFGTRYGSTNIIKTFNSGHSTRPGCVHTECVRQLVLSIKGMDHILKVAICAPHECIKLAVASGFLIS
jgi:hypothetical protein